MCMARLNVYVLDEMAVRARKAGLNVSKLTQQAIETELQRSSMRAWMEQVRGNPPPEEISQAEAQRILDEVRDEFGRGRGGSVRDHAARHALDGAVRDISMGAQQTMCDVRVVA